MKEKPMMRPWSRGPCLLPYPHNPALSRYYYKLKTEASQPLESLRIKPEEK